MVDSTSSNAGRRKTQRIGSRAKVMHGTAEKTSGGLTKDCLMYNKAGRIVSKKCSATAKKRFG
jgi:hypothetical protein|uniref:Uncharacterized protein n=1 Tax=viral metagenome TaxID=1070528 RepID=A0A6C0AJ17_9ZZZZ